MGHLKLNELPIPKTSYPEISRKQILDCNMLKDRITAMFPWEIQYHYGVEVYFFE